MSRSTISTFQLFADRQGRGGQFAGWPAYHINIWWKASSKVLIPYFYMVS